MIHAISVHALERLQERRQLQHFIPHIHKMQGWGIPSTGTFEHKGYRYITREGVLVTVLPPTKEFRQQNAEDELCHRLARIMMICPNLLDNRYPIRHYKKIKKAEQQLSKDKDE